MGAMAYNGSAAQPPETVDIHFGIDFGTSYTKACYYVLDRDERFLVPWKCGEASDSKTLLPTRVWLDSRDRLSLKAPRDPDAAEIRYFKMGLADSAIGTPVLPRTAIRNPPYELYSAFFLAKAIENLEIDITARLQSYLRGKRIQYSGNLGIPIAYFDSPLNARFLRMFTAARYMAGRSGETESIGTIDALYTASLSRAPDPKFSTTPELYAEAAGYFSDFHTPEGSYALFDIGGGTVDSAVISFTRYGGTPRVNFLTAAVASLGLEVVANRLVEAGVEATFNAARQHLLSIQDQYYSAASSLAHDLKLLTSGIIVTAKRKDPVLWRDSAELPVLLCGGGQSSGWHRAAIRATHGEGQHSHCGIPPYSLKEICPSDAQFAEYRYLIAIGLSIPTGSGPEILGFPSSCSEATAPARNLRPDLDDIQRELYGEC